MASMRFSRTASENVALALFFAAAILDAAWVSS